MLHLTVDCSDPSLPLGQLGLTSLPLLYCMRCELAHFDFVYRFVAQNSIKILTAMKGDVVEEWADEVGLDVFPEKKVKLVPAPARVEALFDRLNRNEEISPAEEAEICSFTGNYADREVGGYPMVDVINQISGRSFLAQRLDDPECLRCGGTMQFLASLTNDKRQGFRFSFDSVQIVFFVCLPCRTIHAQHSA